MDIYRNIHRHVYTHELAYTHKISCFVCWEGSWKWHLSQLLSKCRLLIPFSNKRARVLGEKDDSSSGTEIYKMNLAYLIVTESKKVLKTKSQNWWSVKDGDNHTDAYWKSSQWPRLKIYGKKLFDNGFLY